MYDSIVIVTNNGEQWVMPADIHEIVDHLLRITIEYKDLNMCQGWKPNKMEPGNIVEIPMDKGIWYLRVVEIRFCDRKYYEFLCETRDIKKIQLRKFKLNHK